MKLKNKIILITLFFTLFLIFTNRVNAFEINGVDYPHLDETDFLDYYILLVPNSENFSQCSYVFLFTSDSPISLYYNNGFYAHTDSSSGFKFLCESFSQFNGYPNVAFSSGWSTYSSNNYSFNLGTVVSDVSYSTALSSSIVDTNQSTIYYYNTDTVLFQQPPIVAEVPTLAEVVTTAHLQAKEITAESLEAELVELVPVGVVILASLILVSLVAYFRFWRS